MWFVPHLQAGYETLQWVMLYVLAAVLGTGQFGLKSGFARMMWAASSFGLVVYFAASFAADAAAAVLLAGIWVASQVICASVRRPLRATIRNNGTPSA